MRARRGWWTRLHFSRVDTLALMALAAGWALVLGSGHRTLGVALVWLGTVSIWITWWREWRLAGRPEMEE